MGQIPFCEKCGKMLEIKDFMDVKNSQWRNQVFDHPENLNSEKHEDFPCCKMGVCECGFKKFIYSETGMEEKPIKNEELGKGVLENKDEGEGFPNLCPKCGHNSCDIHDLGAPYSDESNVYLFKCRKCGYVVRQADGSGNG